MATFQLIIFLFLFHVLPQRLTIGIQLPSQKTVEQCARELHWALQKVLNKATGKDELIQKYRTQSFVLKPVRGEFIVQEAADKLTKLFQKRIQAVERIAKKAEDLASMYNYDLTLELDRVSFISAKEWNHSLDNLVFRENFPNLLLLPNSSAVHVPLEVYEGWMWHRYKTVWWEDLDTLNALVWSEGLDAVFVENDRLDPTLHWQYFASRKGFLRFYPGHKWNLIPNEPENYDASKRPWYTQPLTSSKDLIILIDMSGSIHGPTFEILKITVKGLLSTLNEHDYFNVAKFSETVSWLIPCFDTPIAATSRNKRLIYQALDHLAPEGKASYAKALNFTFHELLKFERLRSQGMENISSGCHQAVVLISDGGTELPITQLETILNNTLTRDVRLFTLAIGPHPIPTVTLRTMACQTRAFHGAIITFGAIQRKVHDYLQVLSRPLALSLDDNLIQWSISYQDAGGLGNIVSVSKPVFYRTTNASQSLLGVAGVDIPLSIIDTVVPNSQLGFGGYKMVVTSRGTAIVHPELDQHVSFLEDPLVVDFEDLEPLANFTNTFRKKLVNQKKGTERYKATATVEESYVVTTERTWYYQPIGHSNYTLAISVVNGSNIVLPNYEPKQKHTWKEDILTYVAPWTFCTSITGFNSSHEHAKDISYIKKLEEEFEKRDSNCDQSAIGHLLWDFDLISNISEIWKRNPQYHSRFIATISGIVRMEHDTEQFVKEDLYDIRNSSIFLRLANSDASILLRPPIANREMDHFLIATKIKAKEQLLGITGSLIAREDIQSLWRNSTSNANIKEDHHLYWLDEGGYIIASNQNNIHLGAFIGSKHADPQLLKALVSGPSPLFQEMTVIRTAANCPVFAKSDTSSASYILSQMLTWPKNIITAFIGFGNMVHTLLFNILWIGPATSLHSGNTELGLDQLRPPKVDIHLCSKKYLLYRLISPRAVVNLKFNSSVVCSSTVNQTGDLPTGSEMCQREILATLIPETKSVLIVTNPPCKCTNPILQHGLIHVEDELKNCPKSERYRKPSTVCYASDPRENTLECNGLSTANTAFIPSILCTISVVLIIR